MSNIMYSIFNNKKVNLSKLLQFGFVQTETDYIYRKTLSESGFILTVHVTPQGEISTEMIDPSLNELYTLHLVDNATGGFVETVKYEYQETLLEIASQCFQADIFQSKQSNELIDYDKSLRNRLERPFHGHRGGSRGRIYYRFTTFEERALIC